MLSILFRLSIFRARAGQGKNMSYKLLADRFFRKTGNNSQPVAHTLYRLPTRQRERERKGGMEGERERGRRRDGEGKRDREEKGKKKGLEHRDGTEGEREERETK